MLKRSVKCGLKISLETLYIFASGSSKKIHTPHTEEISVVQRGGERNCLKNGLNLYRMYGEEGIVNFFCGGMVLF